MKKPNFFIIGGPKCGTTSLAAWLGEHPNIFIPPVKEPHYFYTDGSRRFVKISDRIEYASLFSAALPQHHAVGEASVYYLFSKYAVQNIIKEIPGAKFIVMLRNPVEMSASLHWQELYSQNEHIADFEKAWSLQHLRAQGKMVKRKCREPNHLLYGEICKLGSQLERLYKTVPKKRVAVILLDDITVNPAAVYQRVLGFLGVDDRFVVDFVPEYFKISSFQNIAMVFLEGSFLKKRAGIHTNSSLLAPLKKFNLRTETKPPISADFKKTLRQYFWSDIQNLEFIIGRDLSHWTDGPLAHCN